MPDAPQMHRVLITGAGGGIGRSLRETLRGVYPVLRLSDRVPLAPARPGTKDRGSRPDRHRRQGAGRAHGRRGRRHYPSRRHLRREHLGEDPRRQHRRALQCVRGGAAGRRQAHRHGDLEPRGRLLSALADDRPPGRAAPGQPLRRFEGVFRGARQPLRRQARHRVSLHPDRQFRHEADRQPAPRRSGSARATTRSSCASAWSTRTSASRSSTASRATSAPGTTIRTPTGSATSRRTIPSPMPRRSSPPKPASQRTRSPSATRAARSAPRNTTPSACRINAKSQ